MPIDITEIRALRHKIEATEGTPEALAAADAVQILDGSGQISRDTIERNLDRPSGGGRPYVPVRRRVVITGNIELAGAATAGDSAPISGMLRNFGHTEALNVGPPANAEYTPLLRGFPSATAYFYHDGELFQASGCRGRLTSIDLMINDFPKAGFEIMGKVESADEAATPDDDKSAFQDPIVGVESNMTVQLGGTALEAVSLSLDPGISLKLVYHTEATVSQQSVRAVTGTLRVYRPLKATKDIRLLANTQAKEAMLVDFVTGTAAKDLSLEAPRVQIGEPQIVDIDGNKGWDIPVTVLPDAGNDDYTLRFGSRV